MRYTGEEAIGLIETLGMVPALEAADKMLKAGDCELVSYENVGSTLVTVIVKGDVAACEAAVKAGRRGRIGYRQGHGAKRHEAPRSAYRRCCFRPRRGFLGGPDV